MLIIKNKEIFLTRHVVDGFTLAYITDGNLYLKQRYIGYTVREAMKIFKRFIRKEVKDQLAG